MDFNFNDQQQLLTDSFKRMVQKEYSFQERTRLLSSELGISNSIWNSFAELGLLGISIPPEYGGFGGGAEDLIGVMEIIGEALIVEPYLSTVCIGARLIALGGSVQVKELILPAVVEGKVKIALAQLESEGRYDLNFVRTRAKKVGDHWVISGDKRLVVHGPEANKLIIVARTAGNDSDQDGISLFILDIHSPGISLKSSRTIDGIHIADIVFNNIEVGLEALIGEESKGLSLLDNTIDFATVMLCAEALGAMSYANNATLEYVKTRDQFGVPIGTFQTVQHRIVDMVISYEQAKSMVYLASSIFDKNAEVDECRNTVSAMKIKVADACRQISQDAVQLHGGMGLSDELKISHTFRRLTVISQEFGDADFHLERYKC